MGESVMPASSSQASLEEPISPAEYVRALRAKAGLDVATVAKRAGVTSEWWERFEADCFGENPNYDVLLRLIRATQPLRPEWWDSGHEHDLHLPALAVRNRDAHRAYWDKIEKVREANRKAPGE